jgi:hypothetical protein
VGKRLERDRTGRGGKLLLITTTAQKMGISSSVTVRGEGRVKRNDYGVSGVLLGCTLPYLLSPLVLG